MNNRLQEFIAAEGLNNRRFADKMGVQASNVSHIINGRNKPGYDFIARMLSVFPLLNPYWLILGQGDMCVSPSQLESPTGPPGVDISSGQARMPMMPPSSSTIEQQPIASSSAINNELDLAFNIADFESALTTAVKTNTNSHNASRVESVKQADIKPDYAPISQSDGDVEKVIIFYKDGRFKSYSSL